MSKDTTTTTTTTTTAETKRKIGYLYSVSERVEAGTTAQVFEHNMPAFAGKVASVSIFVTHKNHSAEVVHVSALDAAYKKVICKRHAIVHSIDNLKERVQAMQKNKKQTAKALQVLAKNYIQKVDIQPKEEGEIRGITKIKGIIETPKHVSCNLVFVYHFF